MGLTRVWFFFGCDRDSIPGRSPTGCDARDSDAAQMDSACNDLPSRIRNHLHKFPARYPGYEITL